jgi:hypothetical protein
MSSWRAATPHTWWRQARPKWQWRQRMATRKMRFALDDNDLKVMVGKLPGTVVSYWEGDSLLRGRVAAAEVTRGRYGKAYVEVELEEAAAAA